MGFQESGHLPYTKTYIGAGPDGATVVLEAEKSGPALQERLWAEFQRHHSGV